MWKDVNMNKKGIFMSALAISIFIVLVYATYSFIVKGLNQSNEVLIGKNQIALTSAYKNSENDLFYVEKAVKLALYKTIDEFSNNGGVKINCNKVWKFQDKDCNPDLELNFKDLLKNNLNKYDLELNNLKIDNNNLYVKLNDKTYNETLTYFEFNYTVKREFKYDLLINMTKLNLVKDKLERCAKTQNNLSNCDINEKSTKTGDIIFFSIENNKKIYSLTPTPGFKNTKFKFGINEKDTGYNLKVL